MCFLLSPTSLTPRTIDYNYTQWITFVQTYSTFHTKRKTKQHISYKAKRKINHRPYFAVSVKNPPKDTRRRRREATITFMVKAAPLRIIGRIYVCITKLHCLDCDLAGIRSCGWIMIDMLIVVFFAVIVRRHEATLKWSIWSNSYSQTVYNSQTSQGNQFIWMKLRHHYCRICSNSQD